ncbi:MULTISPECIES: mannitol-1-phosphate 5-dehydrogenase [unclassified Exiguobacterium]|uniref:mannitol-1-phosphate 5-dehydrogenase n=1 Tax=unclassified Exiguobacterium TaxID=2644629 RepID=UPI00103C2E20|nr:MULTISPECIES: mannitol-1-phosphate 5-dehydrogenase [unclassified Exiguobacterium]TCI66610.1 mannitol-1-phosphate 5-dehydrogenase [Exiguobacterium sp. IPCI3]TCI75793.1 mannitol-1-phosphate 5-dehydrogenase [Exiguobacterium sp. IPCH1]TCI76738.1 mannitol-1-phosphate 5-dehydrogenase [Exiguobacterium sp. IPBC4]
MKAVHFGAGNIGRGFIGLLLNQSGYEVTFVDINDTVIQALEDKRFYEVGFAEEGVDNVLVDRVRGVNSLTDPDRVIALIAEADLVTTAVGPTLLPKVAPLISEGLRERVTSAPVYVIACENMIGGSASLHQAIEASGGIGTANASFPNAAVDRIVPLQQHADPLFVEVETFYEWVIETKGLAERPPLQGVTWVDEIGPYIERKLFTVNTGHAIASYIGSLFGKATIDEALKDRRVRQVVQGALYETGWLLLEKYGFEAKEHSQYIQKIIKRFENPKLKDEVSRVARSPIRKLGPSDRLVKPARELIDNGIEPNELAYGIAAALTYYNPEDSESSELNLSIEEDGIVSTVEKYLQLHEDDTLTKLILEQYHLIREQEKAQVS